MSFIEFGKTRSSLQGMLNYHITYFKNKIKLSKDPLRESFAHLKTRLPNPTWFWFLLLSSSLLISSERCNDMWIAINELIPARYLKVGKQIQIFSRVKTCLQKRRELWRELILWYGWNWLNGLNLSNDFQFSWTIFKKVKRSYTNLVIDENGQ